MSYSRASGPKYREAYPRLDILQAAANARKGCDLCVFGIGPQGIMGALRFTPNQDWTEATLTGELAGRRIDIWNGTTTIELIPSASKFGTGARTANCPSCGKRVQVLVFTDRWGCPSCARLLYRRQIVHRTILLFEELRTLELRPQGRPKGMHQRTFRAREHKATKRIKALRAELKGRRNPIASKHHLGIVEARWLSEEEFRRDSRLCGFSPPGRPASQ